MGFCFIFFVDWKSLNQDSDELFFTPTFFNSLAASYEVIGCYSVVSAYSVHCRGGFCCGGVASWIFLNVQAFLQYLS
jgi:hypothetical protein